MASKEGQKGQTIDLASIPVQQLSQIQSQLKEEVNLLTNSFAKLRNAQSQFQTATTAIKTGIQSPASKNILVPLTTSMYVPGRLADMDKVIVDIGTGYYVEKSSAGAIRFYEGKVEELGSNLKGLEGVITQKSQNLRVIEEVLRQKILASSQDAPA